MKNATCLIKDQGSFATNFFSALDTQEQKKVALNAATFVLTLAKKIGNIYGERNEENKASEDGLPPVLPHQWVQVRTSDLVEII